MEYFCLLSEYQVEYFYSLPFVEFDGADFGEPDSLIENLQVQLQYDFEK